MKKGIIKVISIILAMVLILSRLLGKGEYDGFSSIEVIVIDIAGIVGYIIIPILIAILLLIKKEQVCLVCLSIRSVASIVFYLIYYLECPSSIRTPIFIMFEIIYIAIITYIYFAKKINIYIITGICTTRFIILFLSGSLGTIIYSLNNGILSLMLTGLILLSYEVFMILPVISLYNKDKERE